QGVEPRGVRALVDEAALAEGREKGRFVLGHAWRLAAPQPPPARVARRVRAARELCAAAGLWHAGRVASAGSPTQRRAIRTKHGKAPMGKMMPAIGMMSGTSMDGIDVALLETDGEDQVERRCAASYPYE